MHHTIYWISVYFGGIVNLTWKGYLKLHGIGSSQHTISTHLILESSIQPFIMGFFWNNKTVTFPIHSVDMIQTTVSSEEAHLPWLTSL